MADNTSSKGDSLSSITQVIGGSIGALLGVFMIIEGLTSGAGAKSSIHQIYGVLNYGLGINAVLVGGYIATKAAED